VIHKSAIIAKTATIAGNVTIGAYTVIGKDVTIGEGTIIGPHAVIEGKTKIGRNNKILQFAAIGAPPQDKKFKGEETRLEIGDSNVFREFCTVHCGTVQGHGVTTIGSGNLLMNYTHIAHDCIVGDENIVANCATLAGHVTIGNYVNLSGFAKVAQYCEVGDYSFIGGNTDIVKDVLPYVIVIGTVGNTKIYGLNVIGLQRHGFSEATIDLLKEAYNIIFRCKLTVQQALPKLENMLQACPEIQRMITILRKSEKGIVR
jgi:UDP-N-acetylglucosamine acyltransferase